MWAPLAGKKKECRWRLIQQHISWTTSYGQGWAARPLGPHGRRRVLLAGRVVVGLCWNAYGMNVLILTPWWDAPRGRRRPISRPRALWSWKHRKFSQEFAAAAACNDHHQGSRYTIFMGDQRAVSTAKRKPEPDRGERTNSFLQHHWQPQRTYSPTHSAYKTFNNSIQIWDWKKL